MIYKEAAEQIAFFKWARNPLVLKRYPALELIYCNHNTQSLTKPQAARWKALGGIKGCPDVFLPSVEYLIFDTIKVSSSLETIDLKDHFPCLGLYIEFKNPDLKPKTAKGKGGVSAEQAIVFDKLREAGYKVSVVYSCNEAIRVVEEYLTPKLHTYKPVVMEYK